MKRQGSKDTLIYLAGAILLAIAVINVMQISAFSRAIDKKAVDAKEAARLPQVGLTVITSASCTSCFAIGTIINDLGRIANITSRKDIDTSSPEGSELVKRYAIGKVPSFIITGELEKSTALAGKLKEWGESRSGAYVFTAVRPPYVDTATGKIRGQVSVTTIVKKGCKDCVNLSSLVSQLSSAGIVIKEKKEVDMDSGEGKALVEKYAIKKVPAVTLDPEAEAYQGFIQAWSQIGTKESDGSFVYRHISPPYYSIDEGKMKGYVSLIIIKDKSCATCYDPGIFHKQVLQRLGLAIADERVVDASDGEGKRLIAAYRIEKVPTIILLGDVEEYPALVSAWGPVGTKEEDGSYVFRKVEIVQQPYVNLANKTIITPARNS